MSLYRPWFECKPIPNTTDYEVRHNCDGRINFAASDVVDEKTARLIQLAFEEGKRERSREFSKLLEEGL